MAVAARGRGLVTTVVTGDALAAIDRARGPGELAAALAAAQLPVAAPPDADAVDRLARDRIAADLAVLGRWTDALAPLELDEDRHTLRALVRGLAAGAPAAQRLAVVPTRLLPRPALERLAGARTIEELAAELAHHGHPLAPALRGARTPVDTLELELRLAHRFAGLATARDRALRTYLAQQIDVENTGAALLVATRGAGIDVARAFVAGGSRLDREAFIAAARGPVDTARARLAAALAGTPLAAALFRPEPAALDDAALAWLLHTQLGLRRSEPLGLAPAIYAVLRRRDEAHHLRRAAWRVAMGGS
jgi:vacuolar-type H+-ATPase subunit C/Vma6